MLKELSSFAGAMSLKGVADKFCGGSDETQLKGEGETGKTYTEENGAQVDGGKGANESNVSEKSGKENKETSRSPALEQESLPKHHLAPDNFAVMKPPEGVADKFCGGSDETQLKGEWETGKTSTDQNGARGDGGKGANKSNIFEKGRKENKETGCLPALEQESLPQNHLALNNFAVLKSPEDVAGKIWGGSDEPQLKEEGETGKTSTEQNGAQGDGGKGANEPNVTKKDTKEIKETSCLPAVAIVALVISCFAVAIYCYPNSPENDMKGDFVEAKEFKYGLEKLRSSFINQTDRFWKILRSHGLAHLQIKDPSRPLVFLLAAPPAAHDWVDCLATKLAEKLDPKLNTTLAIIDGEKERENPSETTQETMDKSLKKLFMAGHMVALVHHLELLPLPSPILFHSYCDNQDAPCKRVAIIFTVHMPVEPSPSLSPVETEESVEDYLSGEVWVKEDKNEVAALLSRITDTVVLMNGESSYSAKTHCS